MACLAMLPTAVADGGTPDVANSSGGKARPWLLTITGSVESVRAGADDRCKEKTRE
jgi:hypothetical protein